jgi:hypothetical protein
MKLHRNVLACFLFLIIFSFQQESLKAATLHAFLVCDTHGDQIEASVEADYRNMRNEIRKIARYTGMKAKITPFTGYRVNANFVKAIDRAKVRRDDVVIFYWSGHGKRYETQQDPWPVLDFTYDRRDVFHHTVTEKLMQKRPRLILSLTDCCNDVLSKLFPADYKGSYKDLRDNYRALFLHSKGTYAATAASPGEVALGLNGNWWELGLAAGGFFTNAFLEVLHEETSKSNPDISWEIIFESTINKAIAYQLRDEEDPYIYHHPHYEYIAH